MNEYVNSIINELKTRYPEAEITSSDTVKTGGVVRHGITIKAKGSNIAPCVYVDGMYELGLSVEEAAENVANVYEENKDNVNADVSYITDWEQCKDKVCVRIVPDNDAYLKGKPYFNFLDLKGVFFVEAMENGTVTITDRVLSEWGKTVDEVKTIAIENTRRLYPVKAQNMLDVLSEMGYDGDDVPDDIPMLVYSNAKKTFGANALLISNFGSKPRYILPSSIHEVLSIEADGADPDNLRAMVREVNDTQVIPEERLSYSVYYWDGNCLSIAD